MISIMFPMIISVDEVKRCQRDRVRTVQAGVKRSEGIPYGKAVNSEL